ncbi:MAG: hypothetical protein AAF656_02210, partial [Planctomycetota bacterium]
MPSETELNTTTSHLSTDAAADPCRIDGGYTTVPAVTLAALWCAVRSKQVGVAEVRTWCALVGVEAGLRAAAQSRHRRTRPMHHAQLDQIVAAYWGVAQPGRDQTPYDRRVTRARLNRLADVGLVRNASSNPDHRGGRQRWITCSDITVTADVAALLDGFRCRPGRSLRIPRRWLTELATGTSLGTFAAVAAAVFRCGWGRGATASNGARRAVWSGRVSPTSAGRLLGVSPRTLRLGLAKLTSAGRLEPLPDARWSRQRFGRNLAIRPGPPAHPPTGETPPVETPSARRRTATPPPSARRHAAPDQTKTRLQRIQKPRPTAAAIRGVCRRGKAEHDPWLGGKIDPPTHTGRLYENLRTAGVLHDGPREAIRFFAAAVRAREVGREPIAMLRTLVTSARWHHITDR